MASTEKHKARSCDGELGQEMNQVRQGLIMMLRSKNVTLGEETNT